MNVSGRGLSARISTLSIIVALAACGGTSRFDPGPPDKPAGLSASAGNGQVSLAWLAANKASAYNVYYSTSPGVTKGSSGATKISTLTSTSTIVTGLPNDTTYYFVITSFNSNSESAESNEVFAIPFLRSTFVQADLQGTWRFNALAAGTSPGWMRGTLTVDPAGAVTVTASLDTGNVTAAATLFPALLLDSAGQVRNAADAAAATFTGVMATARNMVVGTSSSNGTQLLAVLQKHDPLVTFIASDIQGFGAAGGGGRRFVYNQISSGAAPEEWEFAQGQIGQTPDVQYSFATPPVALPFLDANSTPTIPGDKASRLAISPDGFVTETANTAITPQPRVVLGARGGVMSDDKSVIVATATDTSGAPRYVLRIYQVINVLRITAGLPDPNPSYALTDLAGTYSFRELIQGGPASLSASGTMQIDATGATAFSSYADTGGGAAPAGFNLAIDLGGVPNGTQNGILTDAAATDTSINGKLAYLKDMVVLTRTVAGASRLTIALK